MPESKDPHRARPLIAESGNSLETLHRTRATSDSPTSVIPIPSTRVIPSQHLPARNPYCYEALAGEISG